MFVLSRSRGRKEADVVEEKIVVVVVVFPSEQQERNAHSLRNIYVRMRRSQHKLPRMALAIYGKGTL